MAFRLSRKLFLTTTSNPVTCLKGRTFRDSESNSVILILASKTKYLQEAEAEKVERRLKTKSGTLVGISRAVVINSKVNDVEATDEISREERKKEASKPLYLTRYE
jgi:hypothetical protein